MLVIDGVRLSFDGQPVLRDIDLTVEQGEILCLLGASGSGKTSLLRIVAGLQAPDGGTVQLEGRSLVGMPVYRRGFGLVFQDFALFPHMTVAENVGFGLRQRGDPTQQQQARITEMLELVGLSGYESREVTSLSGGEKQRVALARSLAPQPRLLMLDEPLGSVDAALRDRLVTDLRQIIKAAGVTAIYVTHDQGEAFAIADRVAVMHAGRIEQVDTPQAIYRRPQTAYIAQFLGLANVLPVERVEQGQAYTAVGAFAVKGEPSALLLHPDGLRLDPNGHLTGTVIASRYQGSVYRLMVSVANDIDLTLTVPTAGDVPSISGVVRLTIADEFIVPLSK